jgi:hypothetical protein
MKTADPAVLELMAREGGSFVAALAEAWQHADPLNSARLMIAFSEYYARYEAMLACDRALEPRPRPILQ